MAGNYYGKCALCEYFDLYSNDGGKYRCTKRNQYFTVFENQCTTYFRPASGHSGYTRAELVDRAREHKL